MTLTLKKENWAVTRGRILSKNIVKQDSMGGMAEQNGVEFVVNVVWEYKVRGKWFKAESEGWGTSSFSRKKEAMAKLKEYVTGMEKDVYYNPEKHSESVFELKSGFLADATGNFVTIMKGFGLGLLVGFVFLMLAAILELQFLALPLS